jgi:hypothetical protein
MPGTARLSIAFLLGIPWPLHEKHKPTLSVTVIQRALIPKQKKDFPLAEEVPDWIGRISFLRGKTLLAFHLEYISCAGILDPVLLICC